MISTLQLFQAAEPTHEIESIELLWHFAKCCSTYATERIRNESSAYNIYASLNVQRNFVSSIPHGIDQMVGNLDEFRIIFIFYFYIHLYHINDFILCVRLFEHQFHIKITLCICLNRVFFFPHLNFFFKFAHFITINIRMWFIVYSTNGIFIYFYSSPIHIRCSMFCDPPLWTLNHAVDSHI